MDEDLWALITETAALTGLLEELTAAERAGTPPPPVKEREYLLRRAIVGQLHFAVSPADPGVAEQARECADRLRDWDAGHRTSRGAVPAADPRWGGPEGAREYVLQEAEAAA
ncbi:hypothetical protein ACFWUQ_01590 [Streptomyces sp. NPDC058662]|uniref:hypothetical protein n=1 Tax=Streptomyces sp. NPDC058662 TaxID=3346583 RepID=UPI003666FBC1